MIHNEKSLEVLGAGREYSITLQQAQYRKMVFDLTSLTPSRQGRI